MQTLFRQFHFGSWLAKFIFVKASRPQHSVVPVLLLISSQRYHSLKGSGIFYLLSDFEVLVYSEMLLVVLTEIRYSELFSFMGSSGLSNGPQHLIWIRPEQAANFHLRIP